MRLTDLDLLIVDASALVELVVAGRHRVGADAFLERYDRRPPLTVISAAHGLIEAISALRRLVRHGHVRPDDGADAVAWLSELDLVLDATAPRARRVWSLREQMTVYDAAYAAASEAFDAPLITADKRLLHACGAAGIHARHLDELATSEIN